MRSKDCQPEEWHCIESTPLVERVSAGSPPGEEDGETNGLEGLGSNGNANKLEGALLSDSLDEDLHDSISN